MSNEQLENRAKVFSRYFGLELKGAIAAQGYSQAKVAEALGHAKSAMSNWLNAKPPISVDVAQKICELIGVDMRTIVDRANVRTIDELGPWPPINVSAVEAAAARLRDIAASKGFDTGAITRAAYRDDSRDAEAETPED